jgi:hypothetical protein
MRKRRHKTYQVKAGKGGHPRLRTLAARPRRQGKLSERGKTSEGVAKRRLRSIKRETGGGAPAKQTKSGWGVQGQRKAIRGNRTRQRRT